MILLALIGLIGAVLGLFAGIAIGRDLGRAEMSACPDEESGV